MVAIEERVHPTPFRTRKLSSPSPMILHNVMWESRPLPKIVRPPCSSQREGVFFCPRSAGDLLFWGRQASGDLKREQRAERETFLEKGSPSPRSPTFPKPFIQVPDGCRDMKILLALPVLRQGLFVFGGGRSGRYFVRMMDVFLQDRLCPFVRTLGRLFP